MPIKRIDGRTNDQLRPVQITVGYQAFADGSALIDFGKTRVICSVSVEDRVAPFLKGTGTGWVTGEYGMLPRSTNTRTPRTGAAGQAAGRSQEIQRLIGRSLRAAVNMEALGERTFTVDCDVLQADGGTRVAAITGGYVALCHCLHRMVQQGVYKVMPLRSAVAAVSVGVVQREHLLDLCYQEDFQASVDFNVVMNDRNEFIEIQGTAEGKPFAKDAVDSLLALAGKGIKELLEIQKTALATLR